MPFAPLPDDDFLDTLPDLQPDRFNLGYSLALQGHPRPKGCPVTAAGWDAGKRLANAAVTLYERAVRSRDFHDVELTEVFGSCVCNRCRQTEEMADAHL